MVSHQYPLLPPQASNYQASIPQGLPLYHLPYRGCQMVIVYFYHPICTYQLSFPLVPIYLCIY